MPTTTDDPALFARTAIGGKRTSKAEARVSDETKFALQRRCHEIGLTESDYIDRLLCISLFGKEHVLSVMREQTEKVCGLSDGSLAYPEVGV